MHSMLMRHYKYVRFEQMVTEKIEMNSNIFWIVETNDLQHILVFTFEEIYNRLALLFSKWTGKYNHERLFPLSVS